LNALTKASIDNVVENVHIAPGASDVRETVPACFHRSRCASNTM
jgi:hypothetical protein